MLILLYVLELLQSHRLLSVIRLPSTSTQCRRDPINIQEMHVASIPLQKMVVTKDLVWVTGWFQKLAKSISETTIALLLLAVEAQIVKLQLITWIVSLGRSSGYDAVSHDYLVHFNSLFAQKFSLNHHKVLVKHSGWPVAWTMMDTGITKDPKLRVLFPKASSRVNVLRR